MGNSIDSCQNNRQHKMPAVSLMSLLDFFCKYSSWQLNCIDFKSPSCRIPQSSEFLWGGRSKAADIKKIYNIHLCRHKSHFLPQYLNPRGQSEGMCLLIKITVMLQNRTHVQQQMLHYHPWVTDTWKPSLDSKLSSHPELWEQATMAMLIHSIAFQILLGPHKWTPLGGSGVLPLHGN